MNRVAGPARVAVELLYFDGCPSSLHYLPRLRNLISSAGVSAKLTPRRIDSEETAVAERFLGSPSVRVDGKDVEPDADERGDYGLQCRLYRGASGWAGYPPDDWVLEALTRATRAELN
jgi:hypothetical protein